MASINTDNKSHDPQMFGTQTAAPVKGSTTQTVSPKQQNTFEDATTSLADLARVTDDYTQDTNRPALTPPKPGSEDASMEKLTAQLNQQAINRDNAEIDAGEFSQLVDELVGENEEFAKHLKPKEKKGTEQPAKGEGKGKKSELGKEAQIAKEQASRKMQSPLERHTSYYIDNEMEKLFDNGEIARHSEAFKGMSKGEIKEKLEYSYFHRVDLESPIHDLIKTLKVNVKDAMDGAKSLKMQKGEIEHEIKLSYENNFHMSLVASDASVKDKQAVEYALYNPEARENLTASQKKLFHDISAEALAPTDQLYGVHRAPQVDGELYNATLSNNYVLTYEDSLKSSLKSGAITKDEYQALHTRLYYPDSVPVDDRIAAMEKSMQANALNGTIAANGLPQDWKPTVSTILFDAVANGTYRDKLNALIRESGIDPKSMSSSQLQALEEQAVDFTIRRLMLNKKWKVTEKVVDPNLEPKIALLAKGAKTFMGDLKELQYKMLEGDDIPVEQKSTYMSYLAIIGEALDDMQQLIYLIESNNAKLSKALNSVLLDAQINKIEKAKDEAAAQREAEQASKGKTVINVIGKILGPVLAILSVVAALAMSLVPPLASLAPLLIGIAIVMVALSISKAAGFDIIGEGFKALDSMLETMIPNSTMRVIAQVMIKAVIVATILIACCICGPGGVLLAMNLGVEALVSSNIISDIVEACGGGEMAQMIATMIVMVVLMVALLAVMFWSMPSAAASLASASASTAEGAGATGAAATSATQSSLQTASTTAKMLNKLRVVTEQLMNSLKAFFTSDPNIIAARLKLLAGVISTLASSTFKIVESAANINMYLILAELAQRIANLKANQEEIDGLIKNLRMIISNMIMEIGGMSDFAKLLNKFQEDKFQHAAQMHIQG